MDPKIQEHSLTPQGRIYKTAVATDEGLQDIGPEFRGTGATPQQKEDDSKSWISRNKVAVDDDGDANGRRSHDHGSAPGTRPQPDAYAQALSEKVPGPLNAAMAKLGDGLESVVGATNSRDTESSHRHVAGGDDVIAVLSDGGHTPEDSLKANLRATTEMLS